MNGGLACRHLMPHSRQAHVTVFMLIQSMMMVMEKKERKRNRNSKVVVYDI